MYSIYKFIRARDSLRQIVRIFHIKQMYIPFYLCDSVRHALFQEDCKPIFYHIDDSFYPMCDFDTDDYVLYPNYFGICTKNAELMSKMYPKLIVDNAHAFFNEPLGIASFNSAYKFNLENFSYLWVKDNQDSQIRIKSYEKEKNIRILKFKKLFEEYSVSNNLTIDDKSIPFCYPYLAESEIAADKLVNKLSKKGYTIYRYWNKLPKSYNEYKFYSRLVPIPIY